MGAAVNVGRAAKNQRVSNATNVECARIILADPRKYAPGSLPSVWAGMVLARATKQAPAAERPDR